MFKDGNNSGGIGDDMFNNLANEFRAFKMEMSRFRDDSVSNFKLIMDILPKKADKEDLQMLEARIVDKLNDLIKQMYMQFADKAETKKKFTSLEKNVNTLIIILIITIWFR